MNRIAKHIAYTVSIVLLRSVEAQAMEAGDHALASQARQERHELEQRRKALEEGGAK